MSPHIDVRCTSTWGTCVHSTVPARSRLAATSNAQKPADGRALREEKDLAPLGMTCWLQSQPKRCSTPRRMQHRLFSSLFGVASSGAKRTACARSMHQKLSRQSLMGMKGGVSAGSVVGSRTQKTILHGCGSAISDLVREGLHAFNSRPGCRKSACEKEGRCRQG